MDNPVTNIGKIFLVLFVILIVYVFFTDHAVTDTAKTLHNLAANLAFTLLGVALTVLVIDKLYERRTKEEHKKALVRDLGVNEPSVSSRALNELSSLGYLTDGTLNANDFARASFSNADLANLKAVGSSFVGSSFEDCDLANADFSDSTLNDAFFGSCGLDRSMLTKVSAINCEFICCDLRETDFTDANLKGTKFIDCQLSDGIQRALELQGALVRERR